MTKGKKLKQENYTATADFMIASLERDLADFTKVFKTIDSTFLEKFKKANDQLKGINSPLITKQQQKETTQALYIKADEFKEKLTLLKAYAKRAKIDAPLLQDTITALKSRNIEKAVKNTRELLPFLTQNIEKIKDMPDNFLEEIPDTITYFEEKSTIQNILMSQSKQATAEVKILYETLYNYIKEVADAGKIIFKGSPKKDDYTISKVLQRMEAFSAKKEDK